MGIPMIDYSRSVGIDVSKDKLDLATSFNKTHEVFNYDRQGLDKLVNFLRQLQVGIVVLEATGAYHRLLVARLHHEAIPLVVKNPREIRDFAKCMGKLAKTDKVDAQTLAQYGARMTPAASEKTPEIQQQIADLTARRDQLVRQRVQEKNRYELVFNPRLEKSILEHIEYLDREIILLEEEVQKLIKSSDEYTRKFKLLNTCKGIGKVTANLLLAQFPELGKLSNEAAAKLTGLAPVNRDSGTLRGKRMTGGGRRRLRHGLYMPMLSIIQHNTPLRLFYERLVAKGKKKLVAIIATMRKLVIVLNAMLKNGTEWKSC
jgi:transposase